MVGPLGVARSGSEQLGSRHSYVVGRCITLCCMVGRNCVLQCSKRESCCISRKREKSSGRKTESTKQKKERYKGKKSSRKKDRIKEVVTK